MTILDTKNYDKATSSSYWCCISQRRFHTQLKLTHCPTGVLTGKQNHHRQTSTMAWTSRMHAMLYWSYAVTVIKLEMMDYGDGTFPTKKPWRNRRRKVIVLMMLFWSANHFGIQAFWYIGTHFSKFTVLLSFFSNICKHISDIRLAQWSTNLTRRHLLHIWSHPSSGRRSGLFEYHDWKNKEKNITTSGRNNIYPFHNL